MSQTIVAHRYAKALLDLAIEKKSLEKVYSDIQDFVEICDNNHDLVLTFKSPIIRHEDKMAIIKKLFENKYDAITFSIFKIITEKNREALIPSIAKEFIHIYHNYKGIEKAEIISAIALSEDQKKNFQKILEDYSGKMIQIVEKVDASLVGGYIVRIGDKQIDDSIRRKLNDLKVAMA